MDVKHNKGYSTVLHYVGYMSLPISLRLSFPLFSPLSTMEYRPINDYLNILSRPTSAFREKVLLKRLSISARNQDMSVNTKESNCYLVSTWVTEGPFTRGESHRVYLGPVTYTTEA